MSDYNAFRSVFDVPAVPVETDRYASFKSIFTEEWEPPPVVAAPPPPPEPDSPVSALGVAGAGLRGAAEGLSTGLPEMVGSAGEFIGAKTGIETLEAGGKKLKEWSQEKAKDWYGDKKPGNEFERIAYEGSKMLAPSIIPAGAFVSAGRLVLGVGKLSRAANIARQLGKADEAAVLAAEAASAAKKALSIGSAVNATALFGASQAQSTIDSAKATAQQLQAAGDTDGARKALESSEGYAPWLTGAISAAGEYFGTKYLGKLFRVDGAAPRTAKELGTQLLKTLGVEIGTEVGQAGSQAAVEKETGVRPAADPLQEMFDVIGPTAFMTLITGGIAGAVNRLGGGEAAQPAETDKQKTLAQMKGWLDEGSMTPEEARKVGGSTTVQKMGITPEEIESIIPFKAEMPIGAEEVAAAGKAETAAEPVETKAETQPTVQAQETQPEKTAPVSLPEQKPVQPEAQGIDKDALFNEMVDSHKALADEQKRVDSVKKYFEGFTEPVRQEAEQKASEELARLQNNRDASVEKYYAAMRGDAQATPDVAEQPTVPLEPRPIAKDSLINGITRSKAGDMMAAGDDEALDHIREGVQQHGTKAMQDAINTELATKPAEYKMGAARDAVREQLARLEPKIKEILGGEKEKTTPPTNAPLDLSTKPGQTGQKAGQKPTPEPEKIAHKQQPAVDKVADIPKDKEPWQMTRDEAAEQHPGIEYDKMLNRAAVVGNISYDEAEKRSRLRSIGGKHLWAQTRDEVMADTKARVKAAKGVRAEANKIKGTKEYAPWRKRADNLKNKKAVASAQEYGDAVLAVHKERVKEALAEGKDVPSEVLAEYPDLQPKQPPTLPEDQRTTEPRPGVATGPERQQAFSSLTLEEKQARINAVTPEKKRERLLRRRGERFFREYDIDEISEEIEELEKDINRLDKTEENYKKEYARLADNLFMANHALAGEKNAPKFAKSTGPAQRLSTVQQTRDRVRMALNKFGAESLLDSGRVKIVQTEEELAGLLTDTAEVKYSKDGRILGAAQGIAYLVADNLTHENTTQTLVHELTHSELQQNGWQGLLGTNYDSILSQVEDMLAANHKPLLAAQQKAKSAGTKPADMLEETITHFIGSSSSTDQSLFKRILSAVNAWLIRNGIKKSIKAEDLVDLAQAAIRRQGITVEEAQRQYDEVVAKYKGTDQWMKTPGGKPTKLNERQWVQVRTPAFLDFFGDWINDPASASKVIDENGEPLVVYHGTLHFDEAEFRPYKRSVYFFAKDSKYANAYAGGGKQKYVNREAGKFDKPSVIPAYLAIKNPVDISGMGPSEEEVNIGGLLKTWGVRPSDYFMHLRPDSTSEKIAEYTSIDVPLFAAVTNRAFTDKFKELGHDGVIMNEQGAKSYAAFSPNQIKSATGNTGQFGKTADIRYSKEEVQLAAKALYSALQKAASGFPETMKYESVANWLMKQPNVKKVELEAVGLQQWLDGKMADDAFVRAQGDGFVPSAGHTKTPGKITRAELESFLQANTVELEDVVLGDKANDTRVAVLAEKKQSLQDEIARTPMKPDTAAAVAEHSRLHNEYMAGRIAGDEYGPLRGAAEKKMLDLFQRDNGDKYKRMDEIGREIANIPETDVHFSQYTEPGAVEGSYREMFVTAPGAEAAIQRQTSERIGREGLGVDDVKALPKSSYGIWQDGHSQYEDVPNPVIRIRFNTVETADGKTVLRIEEMQGPDSANQAKMPGYLKENIYNLGVKRILAYAKENGFDGVALATRPGMTAGETQADRYDLSKFIEKVTYWKNQDGTYGLYAYAKDTGTKIVGDPRAEEEALEGYVGKDLAKTIIETAPVGGDKTLSGLDLKVGGEGLKKLYDETLPRMFEAYGKGKMETTEVGGKIAEENRGISALDEYYDNRQDGETLREYNERVGKPSEKSTMPYLPITQGTPSSYPMFAKEQTAASQFIDAMMRGDEVAAIKHVAGSITYNTVSKKDLNFFNRTFESLEYSARKDPALKRYLEATLNRSTIKYELKDQILGTFLEASKIENTAGYKRGSDYLDKTDRFISGRSIKESEVDGKTWFEVYSRPKVGIYTSEGAALPFLKGDALLIPEGGMFVVYGDKQLEGEYEKENDAILAMIAGETKDYRAKHKDATDAEVKMIIDSRLATNETFNMLTAKMREIIQDAKERGVDEPLVDIDGKMEPLSVVLAQMGDLRGSYMPRIRRPGKYALIATRGAGDNIRENFDWVNEKIPWITPSGRKAETLRKQGYEVRIEKNKDMPESVLNTTRLALAVEAMLTAGTKKVAGSQVEEEIAKLVTESVSDIFKARGARQHMIGRNQKYYGDAVWKGYETDAIKRITGLANSTAAGMAKRDTAKAMILAITGRDISFADYQRDINPTGTKGDYNEFVRDRRIDPQQQPAMHAEVMEHMQEMLRNDEAMDRVVGTAKGIATIAFLGFRVSSAAVNLTNMALAVPATMTGLGKIPYAKTYGLIFSAMSTYGKWRLGGRISDRSGKILEEIRHRGWDRPQFNNDAYEAMLGKTGRAWNKLSSAAMWMFGRIEELNRGATILAAYNGLAPSPGFKDTGNSIDLARLEKAREISDRAHGNYDKAARLAITRGTGFLPSMARSATTFTKFSHNYIMNTLALARDERDVAAVAHMLLAPAVLAGVGASMATPVLKAIAAGLGIGGDDPEEEFYKWAEKEFGAGDWFRFGLAGLNGYGVNLKGSIAIGDRGINTFTELLGAPYAVPVGIIKSAKLIASGDISKGVEAFPFSAVAIPVKGWREMTEGVTTKGNVPVFYGNEPVVGTPLETMWRFMHFNPARISGIREEQFNESKVEKAFEERKSAIYKRYTKGLISGMDSEYFGEIMKEISEYNEQVNEAIAKGYVGVTPITSRGLNLKQKSVTTVPKKEEERARRGYFEEDDE